MRKGELYGGGKLPAVIHDAGGMCGIRACRLDEHRIFERFLDAVIFAFEAVEVTLLDRDPFRGRDAGGIEQSVRADLAAADGRAEDPVADIGDMRQLAESLYGAVLAELPVQQRKDYINALERVLGLIEYENASVRGVG